VFECLLCRSGRSFASNSREVATWWQKKMSPENFQAAVLLTYGCHESTSHLTKRRRGL